MQTFFDWICVGLFIATAASFFWQIRRGSPSLVKYLGVSVGCAVANQLGNQGYALPALVLIGVLLGALVWMSAQAFLGVSNRNKNN